MTPASQAAVCVLRCQARPLHRPRPWLPPVHHGWAKDRPSSCCPHPEELLTSSPSKRTVCARAFLCGHQHGVVDPVGGLSSFSSLWPPAAIEPKRRSSHRGSAAAPGRTSRRGSHYCPTTDSTMPCPWATACPSATDGTSITPMASRHRRRIRGRRSRRRTSVSGAIPWGSAAARHRRRCTATWACRAGRCISATRGRRVTRGRDIRRA